MQRELLALGALELLVLRAAEQEAAHRAVEIREPRIGELAGSDRALAHAEGEQVGFVRGGISGDDRGLQNRAPF